MDAITLLKNDHKTVEQLFKRFERAGDRALVEKREIVDRLIEELSKHAAIEEQLFYPVTRATVPDIDDVALESLEEHHIVKWVLSELETMAPEDERFDAKVTVLIENVRHHVNEEEDDFFPKVRDELGRAALNELGDAMVTVRKIAPTHPHPRSPDTPPGNMVIGAAAGAADRIGDAVSGLAQGSVTAVGDVIATVLGRKKPKVSPRGTEAARSTAGKVRTDVSEVAEAVIEVTQESKRKAEGAGRQVTRRTNRTAKSADRGAKRTSRTAARGAKQSARSARSARKTTTTANRSAKRTGSSATRTASTTARAAQRSTSRNGSGAKRSSRAS